MTLQCFQAVLPLRHPIHTAYGQLTNRRTIILLWDNVAWAEIPAMDDGTYMPETHDDCWHQMQSNGAVIATGLRNNTIDDYMIRQANWPIFNSGLDALAVQINAIRSGQSLWDYVGATQQTVLPTSVTLGIATHYNAYSHQIQALHDQGVRAIKLKIKPSMVDWMVDVVDHAMNKWGMEAVCVDANGSFDHTNWSQLTTFPSAVLIEQPVRADQSALLRQVIQRLPGQILLDESIRCVDDMHPFNGQPIAGIMLKPVCLGGIRPTLAALHQAKAYGIPCGISGYIDSGIGRYLQWMMIHHPLVTGRSDFAGSNHYFSKDVCNVWPTSALIGGDWPPMNRDCFVASVVF